MPRVALHATDPETRLALVRAFESAPGSWDVFLASDARPYDVRVTDRPGSANDISFDPTDPAGSLARVAERFTDPKEKIVTVTGARRGCGVSTLALHLAAACSSVQTTSLIDLDPSSSLRARLGLPADARHWGDRGDARTSAALPHSAGFRLLLAPVGGDADPGNVLRSTASHCRRAIVDAPTGPWREEALRNSRSAVLVVAPTPGGIAAAKRVLDRYAEIPWSCVANRLGPGGALTKRHIAKELGRPVSIELPCSPYLRDREDDCRLLTERWSRYYRRVLRLAVAL
jgi:hypothetical protein